MFWWIRLLAARDGPEMTSPMTDAIAMAIDRLANEPHDTIQGLRRRYYYRGNFVLLEHLTAHGLAVNVEQLRHRGDSAHAEALAVAWNDANGRPLCLSGRGESKPAALGAQPGRKNADFENHPPR